MPSPEDRKAEIIQNKVAWLNALPAYLDKLPHCLALYDWNKRPMRPKSALLLDAGRALYPLAQREREHLTDLNSARNAAYKHRAAIAGVTFLMDQSQRLFCFDLDSAAKKLQEKQFAEYSAQEKALLQVKYNAINEEILAAFAGKTYIERSMSGNGWHIIGYSSRPIQRMNFDLCGSIFTHSQFIHLTGDLAPGSQNDIYDCGDIAAAIIEKYSASGDLQPVKADADALSSEMLQLAGELHHSHGRVESQSFEEFAARLGKVNKASYAFLMEGKVCAEGHSDSMMRLIGDADKIEANPSRMFEWIMGSKAIKGHEWNADRTQNRVRKWHRNFIPELARRRPANDRLLAEREKERAAHNAATAALYARPEAAAPEAPPPGMDELEMAAWEAAQAAAAEDGGAAPVAEVVHQWEESLAPIPQSQKVIDRLSAGIPAAFLEPCLPPGKMGGYVEAVMCGMYEPDLRIATIATIAQMAPYFTRWASTPDGQPPTLQAILAGTTGLAKTQAVNSFHKMAREAIKELHGARGRSLPMDIVSREGAHDDLSEVPSCCVIDNDAAAVIQSIFKPVSGSEKRLGGMLLKLFDIGETDEPYQATKSVGSRQREHKPIHKLRMSFLWSTVIDTLSEFCSAKAIGTGHGSRILFVIHRGISGKEQSPFSMLSEFPDGEGLSPERLAESRCADLPGADLIDRRNLRKAFAALAERAVEFDSNYAKALETRSGWPRLCRCPIAPDAQEFYLKFLETVGEVKRSIQRGDDGMPEYYSMFFRIGPLALRIATGLAIVCDHDNPVLRLPHLWWAIGYVIQNTGALAASFDDNTIGTDLSRAEETLVSCMVDLLKLPENRKHGYVGDWQLKRMMKRRAPFSGLGPLGPRMVDDVVKAAGEMGGPILSKEKPVEGRGRPAIIHYLVKK